MPICVAFIGGGSGGHLFPAVVIAQELLRQHPEAQFLFLISDRAVDRQILAASGLSNRSMQIVPYATLSSRRGFWKSAMRLPSLWRSLRQARRLLKSFQPHIVVGLGALASVPGVVAASRLGLPVVLLEQNCLPGKATRVLARRARLTVFGLPVEVHQRHNWPSPVLTCGTPVRAVIRELAHRPVDARLERTRILILGGSQGSHSVNQIVVAAICEGLKLPLGWDIVHQTGEKQVALIRDQYQTHGIPACVEAFLFDLPAQLAAAGIVVSRAGAVTIQEAACAGVPSILIPLSTAADNHQMLNARLLEGADAAFVIDEENIDAVNLFRAALEELLRSLDLRQRRSQAIRSFATPGAATEISRSLIELAGLDS